MKNRWIVTVLVLLVSTSVRGADLFNKSYAVVIGISSYQNHSAWETLDNAENDAKAMDEFLTGQGFEVKRFIGRQATKSNIGSYLEDTLAPRLESDDRFIFYFSGHGNTKSLGGSDRGYLIPYDGDAEQPSTWIAMEQLQELAGKLGNARHQLFILDSCFGGLFATKGSKSSIPKNTPSNIATMTGRRARQYLTAGGKNEETPARSNLDGYREYSHYTAYLLKGLREGIADKHPDGFITASELDLYLEEAAWTSHNTPCRGHFPGHEQGEFVFRSPKPAQIRMSDPVPVVPTKGNDRDEDRHDWEMLSKLGEGGLQYYLYLHPDGKWADEARDRIDRLREKGEDGDTKRPLNIVELDSPDISFTFLSTGEEYRSGEMFPPPKTIDCSRLKLEPAAFKDAIEAGALIVRINGQPEAVQVKSIDNDGKETTEVVKIKTTYSGVLALCKVSDKATGPDSRSYRIRGLDEYLAKGKNGLVSVVGAMLPYDGQEYFLKELIESIEKEMGFTYQYASSNRFSWMLWLTDRTATFTNYEAELDRRKASKPRPTTPAVPAPRTP